MSDFPKWVQRAPGIGAVLCLNAKEEQKLLEDYENEQLEAAEKAAAEAQADAAEAKEAATLNIPTGQQGGKRK